MDFGFSLKISMRSLASQQISFLLLIQRGVGVPNLGKKQKNVIIFTSRNTQKCPEKFRQKLSPFVHMSLDISKRAWSVFKILSPLCLLFFRKDMEFARLILTPYFLKMIQKLYILSNKINNFKFVLN